MLLQILSEVSLNALCVIYEVQPPMAYISAVVPHLPHLLFTNADWAGNIDDRKSTGGYLVFFGKTLVS